MNLVGHCNKDDYTLYIMDDVFGVVDIVAGIGWYLRYF
jgi:hypothetical protein